MDSNRTRHIVNLPQPYRFAWLVLAALMVLCSTDPKTGHGGSILVSPHDDHHLVPLGPGDFRDERGAAVKAVPERSGAFDQTALVVDGRLVADLKVRHAGRYALWVRVGRPHDRPHPIQVKLTNGDKQVLAGAVNDDAGNVARGGPQGRAAFQQQAKKNTPAGLVPSLDAKNASPDKKAKPADDLTAEILGEPRGKPSDPWVNLLRVEELIGDTTFYWWKLEPVELRPGRYRLHLEPTEKLPSKPADRSRVDAAFLTTNDKLVYPYAGDIGHSLATFVRFRIDKLPKEGLRIAGAFQTHIQQFPRLSAVFGPGGLSKEGPHTRTGFTCWYRLQDIAKMPDAGPREIGMQVSLTAGKVGTTPASGYAGATQFASFPHADFVVREFDWLEPTGLAYTVPLDCETYVHRLMSFRDHAREHYEMALAAADRINPLTRGELYFTGICGAWNADDRDYMRKTIRLLGFNSVAETGEPLPGRKQYGWAGAEFVANLPLGFPLDEAKARQEYEDYFRKLFADPKTLERWKDARSFCTSDEPGEAYRAQMTAPVWQYHEEKGKGFWLDPIGSSELYTRPTDLGDCVVEGVAEHLGRTLDFHVGVDEPQQPAHYWYWRLGYPLGPANNANLMFGEHVEGQPALPARLGYRMIQSLGNTHGQLRFKIVQQKGTATLFINGKTIHQHKDLPKKVCFGISGGTKRIYELRLRPLRPGEGVAFEEGKVQDDADKKKPDTNLEDFGLGNLPAWAKPKPLRRAVEEDWIEAGGDPAVKEAFRRWAQARGLTAAMFGAKDWQQVRPLTMPSLVRNEDEARLFYWSRRFSGQLTPRRFEMISDAVGKFAPNPDMWNYAALSGGALYRAKEMPVDMFALASYGRHHTGGISDWMFYSSWRWDSHQAVAYSAELFNAGARRHGERPVSFPMMHCVSPTIFRAYTQVANQVKILSLYDYGPHYLNMPDSWSQNPACYEAVSLIANRAALCDDILAPGLRRPGRVALLYAHSTEYWNPASSFDDKRSTFLGLSHEYFQPEVVTEQQVLDGALKHYDALYVLEPNVAAGVQTRIGDWVRGGGLVWACANALTRDEYNRPADLLQNLAGLARSAGERKTATVRPEQGAVKFRPHTVIATGMPATVDCPEARILARYEDGGPAWLQKAVDKGKVIYVGHRAGSTYASKNIQANGYKEVWADTGRELLTAPLHEANIARPLVLSESAIVATATDTDAGSVVILYNMKPTPRRGLVVRLREAKAPHSVETFEGLALKPIPFEHRDGWVSITLKDFDEGQMVVVRRQPKPADDRLEQMRQRTLAQLESKDPELLSTGAWFAGFFPEWRYGDRIAALLDHPSWTVRRSAAEAVGRLRHAPARDRLWTVAQTERDAHALADQLLALALLNHPGTAEFCQRSLGHRHFLVRRQALRALSLSTASTSDQEARGRVVGAARAALSDRDQRVRREAIAITGRLNPGLAAIDAGDAFLSGDPQGRLDRPFWTLAVASNDVAFASFLASEDTLRDALRVAVARHRRDLRLANSLVAMAPTLSKDQVGDWVAAMLHQRSPEAARKLFAKRADLPESIRSYLPLILEHSLEANLGQVIPDWEAFLAGR